MKYAAVAPLFDRLVDEDLDSPVDAQQKRFMSLEELQASIVKDLSNLLNTRVSLAWQTDVAKIAAPYAYGVNTQIALSPDNVADIRELEYNIDKAIRDFEPRLIDARAHVIGIGNPAGTLTINIEAVVAHKNHHSLLSFPIVISI